MSFASTTFRDSENHVHHHALNGAVLLAACAMLMQPCHAETAREEEGVRIAIVGDVMLDGGPGHMVAHGKDPFAHVAAVLQQADLAVANLECVAGPPGGEGMIKDYRFKAPPKSIAVLKRHLSAVSLANNHSGDYGKSAFLRQLTLLEEAKLPYFGGGRSRDEARRPAILTCHGRRIALLGYNDFPPRSFAAGEKTPGIAWLVEADVLADIRRARSEHRADFVIPFLHWGAEMQPGPGTEQQALARRMIDAGADAVVGGHAHVVQTVDIYRGRPIIYSLGNFVFNYYPEDPPVFIGWIVELTLGKKSGVELKTTPVQLDPQGVPRLLPNRS